VTQRHLSLKATHEVTWRELEAFLFNGKSHAYARNPAILR